MSHFEIAITVYSVLSTIGLGLTVYYGRKLLFDVEWRIANSLYANMSGVKHHIEDHAAHLGEQVRGLELSAVNHAEAVHDSLKADISRVEKWITDHAEELKSRAEDLRVRALDLHDKTAASDTRQPPVR